MRYRLEDGRYPVEDRLHVILGRVRKATQAAIAYAEAAPIRETEAERARIEAAAEAERVREGQRQRSAYDGWLQLLQSQHDVWKYHNSLATFVDELSAAVDRMAQGARRDEATAYAEWARTLVSAADPVHHGLRVPAGEAPDLDHHERLRAAPLRGPRSAGRAYGPGIWLIRRPVAITPP